MKRMPAGSRCEVRIHLPPWVQGWEFDGADGRNDLVIRVPGDHVPGDLWIHTCLIAPAPHHDERRNTQRILRIGPEGGLSLA